MLRVYNRTVKYHLEESQYRRVFVLHILAHPQISISLIPVAAIVLGGYKDNSGINLGRYEETSLSSGTPASILNKPRVIERGLLMTAIFIFNFLTKGSNSRFKESPSGVNGPVIIYINQRYKVFSSN